MRNNLLFAICIISSLFTWTGCSNKLDVIGTWEALPVIYGLLNPVEDSVTYIRVEKAFLPPDQSANEVAQLPDSIYYNPNDIDVLLFENDVLVEGWESSIESVDLTFEKHTNYSNDVIFLKCLALLIKNMLMCLTLFCFNY